MNSRDILNQKESRSMAFEASGDSHENNSYWLDIRIHYHVNVKKNSEHDAIRDEHYLCRKVRQITIQPMRELQYSSAVMTLG